MLYPIKKPFAIHEIKRGEHTLYIEEYGNKAGLPAIFLHGGPGSGCSNWQKSLFDKKIYRVIFLDQRGSGKSTPKRLLKNNAIYTSSIKIIAIFQNKVLSNFIKSSLLKNSFFIKCLLLAKSTIKMEL